LFSSRPELGRHTFSAEPERMTITWKKHKTLRPAVILKRIEQARQFDKNGQVSFLGFELHGALPALRTMLASSAPGHDFDLAPLMRRAIGQIKGPLTPDLFVAALNDIRRKDGARKAEYFDVLTSVSMNPQGLSKTTRVGTAVVRLSSTPYPKKYKDRHATVVASRVPVAEAAPGYSTVIVTVEATGARQAARRALRGLDVLRAVWCLLGNFKMEIIGQEWKPINRVRLGPIHTVHKGDTGAASEEVWFEPSFSSAPIFSPSDPRVFQRNVNHVLKRLKRSPYEDVLRDGLLRYVQALDEPNQSNALVKLWSALEILTLGRTSSADYSLMVRRASSVFVPEDREYNEQILEHLRETRNDFVHAGTSEDAKTSCYQLQYYFFNLMLFLLNGKFQNLGEAHLSLDLPNDLSILQRRAQLLRAAMKFRASAPVT
jgi:hypothetical protein